MRCTMLFIMLLAWMTWLDAKIEGGVLERRNKEAEMGRLILAITRSPIPIMRRVKLKTGVTGSSMGYDRGRRILP